jgi:DNA replication protein DnaC
MQAIGEIVETVRVGLPPRFSYLAGCGKCNFGRIWLMPVADAYKLYPYVNSVPKKLLMMFRDGCYSHCDCEAGQSIARVLERNAAELEASEFAMRETVARSARARLERIFDEASVPNRFAELTWDGFKALAGNDAGKRLAIQAIDLYAEAGSVQTHRGKRMGLLLYGRSDMGKTGALSPIFLRQIKQGLPGLWVQYNDLLAALKQFESGQVEERIRAAQHTEYLFIDDFGDPGSAKTATDYAREVVFRIIDHRNNYQKPTFITSNLGPDRLAAQFGERILKRIDELCLMVEVKGQTMGELMDVQHETGSYWDNFPIAA